MSNLSRFEAQFDRSETVVFNYFGPPINPPPEDRSVTFLGRPYQVYYEEMTPNSDGSHKAWKSFHHYKSDARMTDNHMAGYLQIAGDWGSDSNFFGYTGIRQQLYAAYHDQYGQPGRLDDGLPAFYVPGVGNVDNVLQSYDRELDGFVPPPDRLNELVARSFQTTLPIIKAELSLVNSIIELRDFKSLPETISKILNLSPDWKKVVDTLKRFLHTPKGRSAARKAGDTVRGVAAESYLQYSFNIAPLLSDISGIYTALSRTERRINDLITRSGSVQQKHFAFNWIEYVDTKETITVLSEVPPVLLGGSLDLERVVVYSPTIFHAEIRYNYNYSGYQVAHAQILALLDAFGVNLNPVIIWNAIPWSFVIDWVFGVSRFLDQYKLSNMEPTINIHEYLWSVKRARTIYVNRLGSNLSGGYFSQQVHGPVGSSLPVVRQSAYRRSVGMPGSSSIVLGGLNLKEFSLGAALVLARRRRPHRKQSLSEISRRFFG